MRQEPCTASFFEFVDRLARKCCQAFLDERERLLMQPPSWFVCSMVMQPGLAPGHRRERLDNDLERIVGLIS